jgi:hypothetical protein
MNKHICLAVWVSVAATACALPAAAGPGDCDPDAITSQSAVTAGTCEDKVTERCLRRVAEGVRVTCDSGEVAVSVFCEQNGTPSGNYSALVSAGIMGRRTGACLWSNQTDGTIVVGCKAVGKRRNNFSGDTYSRYQRVPK